MRGPDLFDNDLARQVRRSTHRCDLVDVVYKKLPTHSVMGPGLRKIRIVGEPEADWSALHGKEPREVIVLVYRLEPEAAEEVTLGVGVSHIQDRVERAHGHGAIITQVPSNCPGRSAASSVDGPRGGTLTDTQSTAIWTPTSRSSPAGRPNRGLRCCARPGRCVNLTRWCLVLDTLAESDDGGVASPQTLSEADRRTVAGWAADCAERVLALFEAEAPAEDRPRDAIARARAFARGELGAAEEIRRRVVAGRAASGVGAPAAVAAVRAAAQAAGVAHMGAHALGAAAYAAKAAGLAAPDQPGRSATRFAGNSNT